MNVVVNAVSARTGGGLTYLRELLPRLAECLGRAGVGTHVLVSEDVRTTLEGDLRGSAVVVHSPLWATSDGIRRVICEQARLPALLRRLSAAAVLNTGDTLPLASRVPQVLLCRNMLLYNSVQHTARLRALRLLALQSVRHACTVVFVSNTLAARVLSLCPIHNWRVIHHGPGVATRWKPNGRIDHCSTIIVASSLYDYKRLEIAVEATSELRSRGRPTRLRIVGRAVEEDYAESLRNLVRELGMEEAVTFSGEASAAEVVRAYDDAAFAFVTSAQESFCHPVLEAFAAGVPLIVPADLAVAQEIAGNAAVRAEPNGAAFADAVEVLLRDPSRYEDLVSAGSERVRMFSWDESARQTAAVLLSCIQQQAR